MSLFHHPTQTTSKQISIGSTPSSFRCVHRISSRSHISGGEGGICLCILIICIFFMQLCLEVWGTDYNRIKETCIFAERLGYFGFYYGEALADIDLDCWTVISSLIPLTNEIKLGPVITYLYPQYRSIALLAKQAATFQEMSNGRLEFRTGAGATLQYAIQWWHPYGINYPKESERVSMLEEGIQILKMLWNQQDSDLNKRQSTLSTVRYNGKYFKINGASPFKLESSNTNTRKRIPITISGKRKHMLNLAARFADIWEASYLSPQEFSKLNVEFERMHQRPSNEVENTSNSDNTNRTRTVTSKSIELDVIIAKSDSDLEYKKKIFAMERGPNVYEQILKHGLIGTPEKVAARVKEYTDAGINQFFLAFQNPFDLKALELFMDTIG
jgi:alkanesulfonate monooxygenase SsuD/methylene tetrahydromethanopterin reductase-like flavin-dependent oxidoreductase (luciferase family)